MPKVYLSKSDRQRTRLTASIHVQMKQQGVTTTDLGRAWNMTQQAAAYRIREGIITVMDLWAAQPLLNFTDDELSELIRGDRDPVVILDEESGETHRPKHSRRNRNR